MGRHSDPDPGRGQMRKLLEPALQAGKAVLRLSGVRPENLLVRDARAAFLGERLDHSTGISGVSDGGNSGPVAIGPPLTSRPSVVVGSAGGLELPQTSDPSRELRIGYLA